MNLFKTSSLILALSLLITASVPATEMMEMDTAETTEADHVENHAETDLTEQQAAEIQAQVNEAVKRKEERMAALEANQKDLDADLDTDVSDTEDRAPESPMEDVDSDHAEHMGDTDSAPADEESHVSSKDLSASKKLDEEITNLLKQIAESQNNSSNESDSNDATA